MQTQTSSPTLTTKDPRISAVQLDLQEAGRMARDVSSRLHTYHERSTFDLNARGVFDGLSELVELLERVQSKLSCVGRPADPERLRRVVLNSLTAQS